MSANGSGSTASGVAGGQGFAMVAWGTYRQDLGLD